MPDFTNQNTNPSQTSNQPAEPEVTLDYGDAFGAERLPWYKSFWKVTAFVVLVGSLLVGLLFAGLLYIEYSRINSGQQPFLATNPNSTNTNTNKVTTVIKATPGTDSPYLGNVNAPVEIIAFEDFQCPYCKEAAPVIAEMLSKHSNDVVYYYRHFPLYTIHPQAQIAAEAAECAAEYGLFWQYHDLAYEQQDELTNSSVFSNWATKLGIDETEFTDCVESGKYTAKVQADLDAGLLAGVNSTPTWAVNGTIYRGVLTSDQWEQIISAELAKKQ